MKRFFNALRRNTDRILKVLQIAALVWIGVELHYLVRSVDLVPELPDACADPSGHEEKTAI